MKDVGSNNEGQQGTRPQVLCASSVKEKPIASPLPHGTFRKIEEIEEGNVPRSHSPFSDSISTNRPQRSTRRILICNDKRQCTVRSIPCLVGVEGMSVDGNTTFLDMRASELMKQSVDAVETGPY